ncbi:glycerol kinase [Atractiella rhizophila]|nr:glycerol kinase [Atractiella rhizophila]
MSLKSIKNLIKHGKQPSTSTSTPAAPKEMKEGEFVAAIDAGTTSCRFFVFDAEATVIASAQEEFEQIYPQPGWHEHRPKDWITAIDNCIKTAVKELEGKGYGKSSIKAVGITNQRETTVVWDKETGEPITNAIVWPDTRNTATIRKLQHRADAHNFTLPEKSTSGAKGQEALRELTGLPISTYFAGTKLRWMLDHNADVKKAFDDGRLMWGTVETYLVYKFTNGETYVTDYTNASRTMLLNLHTLAWDDQLLEWLDVKGIALPTLVSNSEVYGNIKGGILEGIPIAGIVGDQQAAVVGNKCLSVGQAKNTYGTGCFMLYNTGPEPVKSTHGLLTTVAYKAGKEGTPIYALEGSIAVAGSSVKWIRDNLNMIKEASDIGDLAAQVKDTGGVYFVTGFSGLFAPYWDDSATGCLIGISAYTTKHHIARATLEATCWQTKSILDAMEKDSGKTLAGLTVDGGMTNSDQCMQIQADILGIEVERPTMRESTALGSALLAGAALKLFGWNLEQPDTLKAVNTKGNTIFKSEISADDRAKRYAEWNRAIERSKGWRITTEEN